MSILLKGEKVFFFHVECLRYKFVLEMTIKLLTHYQTTNFRLVQLKQSADDSPKFYENSRKFSKWIENTVFSKGLFPRGVKRCHCVGMG